MDNELYIDNDELRIYRGEDFIVSDNITIHQPTLDEICNYGESNYFSMIYTLVSTPQSMKVQLWDMGIDYTEITPYELFYSMIYKILSKEQTKLIFGDLDFQKFKLYKRNDNDEVYLNQKRLRIDIHNSKGVIIKSFVDLHDASQYLQCSEDEVLDMYLQNKIFITVDNVEYGLSFFPEEVTIDEYTYNVIVDYICKSHVIERDLKIPMNNTTKEILIQDARDEMIANQNKKYKSRLRNLISSMVNSEGFKYNHSQVWEMKINAFMDSVKRISKIKTANLLLQSGYSGFGIDLKEINKKQLDWQGELE